jgi:hypothetical protein
MLTEHILLDAEPATEGRLLTLLLVGGRGTRSRLASRVLGPFEGARLAKVELFREHACNGQQTADHP